MTSALCKSGLPLDRHDPLHGYLSSVVLPEMGHNITEPEIDSICLSYRQSVYLYRERKSDAVVVGKFFGNRKDSGESNPGRTLEQEFNNLLVLRGKGFCSNPYNVVRPLSKVSHINYLLVEEYISGHDLDYYIVRAACHGQHERLFKKLGYLAEFIALLHEGGSPCNASEHTAVYPNFKPLLDKLLQSEILSNKKYQRFLCLADEWKQEKSLWYDRPVLIHGDVTPTNFIFHHKEGVTAIDLERMRQADRMFDIGIMAAELKHHFAWRILNAGASDPFIEHFIKSYFRGLNSGSPGISEILMKNRLFMAYGELRIARNQWLSREHRKWLIREAIKCMSV